MSDLESFENEGGRVLIACSRCGRLKPLYHEDLCLSCWIELNPLNATFKDNHE